MVYIAPSLLSCDFKKMGEELLSVQRAGADWAHLDVMDGVFVTNLTFGLPVISSLRSVSDIPFDVHLMIVNPENYIARYAEAGADLITVHLEACEDVRGTLRKIRDCGKKAGLSIKPATPAEAVYPYLDELDLVLVMTVEPGYGGQKMIPSCLEKVRVLRKKIDLEGRDIRIQVDGGISPETAPLAREAGADVLVAGSAIFSSPDRAEAIAALRA